MLSLSKSERLSHAFLVLIPVHLSVICSQNLFAIFETKVCTYGPEAKLHTVSFICHLHSLSHKQKCN